METTLALTLLTALSCTTAVWGVYHLFFDPLRHFPGPKLWSMSMIPYHYHTLRADHCSTMHRLHQIYGPVVRIGPNDVSFVATSENTWKTIYAAKPEMGKSMRGTGLIPTPNGASDILVADNTADHTRFRKALSPGFSQRAIREHEPTVRSYFDEMVDIMHKKGESQAFDMQQLFLWCFFDIIGDLSLGASFEGLKKQDNHPWVSTALAAVHALSFINVFLYYRMMPVLERIKNFVFKGERPEFFKHTYEKTAARLDAKSDRKDFISFLERDPKTGQQLLTRDEIAANASELVLGGSDTTVTTMCGAMYFLLTHPDVYEKLCGQVRAAFPIAERLSFDTAKEVPYLDCVLNETWRLYPPSLPMLPRIVPGKGASIDGWWVPGDTNVGVTNAVTCQYPSNFHNASAFAPERWLPVSERPEEYNNDKLEVAQPFSYGNRNCLGKTLATSEVRYLLARLLLEFDFELSDQTDSDWLKQKEYFTPDRKPLFVIAEPRLTTKAQE